MEGTPGRQGVNGYVDNVLVAQVARTRVRVCFFRVLVQGCIYQSLCVRKKRSFTFLEVLQLRAHEGEGALPLSARGGDSIDFEKLLSSTSS